MDRVFKSEFTLRFLSSDLESEYQKIRNSKLRMWNIIYSCIFLALTSIYTVIYWETSYDKIDKSLLDFIKIISFCLIGIHSMLLILSVVFKRLSVQRIITYFNIGFLLLSDFTFRMFLIFLAHPDYLLFTLVFLLQNFLTVTLLYTNGLDFLEGFWIYLTVACTSYAVYAGLIELRYHYFFAINLIVLMTMSLMSYFYVREKRKSFLFNNSERITIELYKGILETINSGFISVTNRKTNWINKSFLTLLDRLKECSEDSKRPVSSNKDGRLIITNGKKNEQNYVSQNLEIFDSDLDHLFGDIIYENNSIMENKNANYQTAVDFIKAYSSFNNLNENFIFLGNKQFNFYDSNNDLSKFFYKVYGRFTNPLKIKEEEKFEFIFNDCSKEKMAEEINAEMKYKAFFLSKVAHEFKNPLISISELIDQAKELLNATNNLIKTTAISFKNNPSTNAMVLENLSQIKSLSEYLLIFVKDLDFLSLKYAGATHELKLEKDKVNLDRITNYCNDITNVLLKKYQKERSIKFKVECKEDLLHEEIYTDEVRLKQLLINLLSNSVKYTHNGTITLKIQEEDEKIVFDVIDTGIGLSDQNIKKLKDIVYANKEISANSSGLGFSIMKELIELFQTKLDFETVLNQGTRFYFSLDKIKTNSMQMIDSPISQNNMSSNSSVVTVEEQFQGILSEQLRSIIHNKNYGLDTSLIKIKNENFPDEKLFNLTLEPNTDYYLVVDDEDITRKSTIRMLNNYFTSNNQTKREKVIIESADGIQCLNYFYESIKRGINFSLIISDETMTFMNGSSCAKILSNIIKTRGLAEVPFFIITAYENLEFKKEDGVDKIYTKPITVNNIEEMLKLISRSNQ